MAWKSMTMIERMTFGWRSDFRKSSLGLPSLHFHLVPAFATAIDANIAPACEQSRFVAALRLFLKKKLKILQLQVAQTERAQIHIKNTHLNYLLLVVLQRAS
jgi:hypothetical protein